MSNTRNYVPPYVQPNKIKEIIGVLGRTTALNLEVSDPSFPKRLKIVAGRITAWRTQDLIDWIEAQNQKNNR